MMMAAGEVMAQFMREQNAKQRQRKRQSRQQRRRIAIDQSESLQECIERSGPIVRVGGGKMRASNQRSNQRQDKQS